MPTPAVARPEKSTNVRLGPHPPAGRLRRAVVGLAAHAAPGLTAEWAIRAFCTPPRDTREHEPIAATARRLLVPVGGRAVRAWLWGAGPVALLVHGWGGRATQLAGFAPPLVATGHAVVAFDAPAHGDSDGRRASLLDFRDAVQAVAARVGPVESVVAHSLGAAATALAMRDGLTVERAVFLAPPAAAVTYLRRFLRAAGIPPALAPVVEARFEARGGFRWADLTVPAVAPGLSAPLLVIHDRRDREVPWAEGAAIAAAWPGARLVSTEGLGHRRLLRDPGVVAQTVAFVGAHPVTSERCATPGCRRTASEAVADGIRFCVPCAIEHELYDREARWARVFPPHHVEVG